MDVLAGLSGSVKRARLGTAQDHLKEACDAGFLLARNVDANDSFAHDVIKKLQHHLRRLETVLRRRDSLTSPLALPAQGPVCISVAD